MNSEIIDPASTRTDEVLLHKPISPPRRRSLALLSAALMAFAAQAVEASPMAQKQDACTAELRKESEPGIQVLGSQVGPTNTGIQFGDSHLMLDMVVPDAIPIALFAFDSDTLFLECLRDCYKRPIGGEWTASWSTVDVGFGGGPGGFVGPSGDLVSGINDAQAILYVPPRDLHCGEFRTIAIHAEIFDPVADPALKDSIVDAFFQVDVWRLGGSPASYYWSMVTPFLPTPADIEEPQCDSSPETCCKLIGDVTLAGSPITATVLSQPTGMLVGDKRMITLHGEDIDRVIYECGVPPDCPSAFEDEKFTDGLTYTWLVVGGPATITPFGRTAIVEAGSTPGKVDIQVIVQDCGGYCFNDPDLTLDITIDVYAFDFIDSTNQSLPVLANPTTLNEGLQISRVITNEPNSLNGCGDPNLNPNYAGPVPTVGPDTRTYRTGGSRGVQTPDLPTTVRIRTNRAWDAGRYEGTQPYDATFPTVSPSQGSPAFRSDRHIRLVSNTQPQVGGLAGGTYDDEVCGDQSVLALPGDWVVATLIVDGAAVGFRELPVERPWNEPNANLPTMPPTDGPHSIHKLSVNWMAVTNSPGVGNGAFHTQRITEDFAQAGFVAELENESTSGPYSNTLWIATYNLPAATAGTITINMTNEAGVAVPVQVQIPAGTSLANVASEIVTAINNEPGLSSTSYFNPLMTGIEPFIIVVNKGSAAMAVNNASAGSTGVQIMANPFTTGGVVASLFELTALGLNMKPVDPQNQTTVDIVTTNSMFIEANGVLGSTYVRNIGMIPYADLPGLAHTAFLGTQSSNGNDALFAQVCSHEVGHLLLDEGSNSHHTTAQADEHLLMADGSLFGQSVPQFNAPESPENLRRLLDTEIRDIHLRSPQFLRQLCTPIPERL